ncbi:MAG: T9SS type A sorting domain-containing protein, partial [Bacteroidota bacterium]
ATINAPEADDYTIYVIGNLGQRIFELKGRMEKGRNERKIDLRPIAPGNYMVIFRKGDEKVVRRIIINR